MSRPPTSFSSFKLLALERVVISYQLAGKPIYIRVLRILSKQLQQLELLSP